MVRNCDETLNREYPFENIGRLQPGVQLLLPGINVFRFQLTRLFRKNRAFPQPIPDLRIVGLL
jgi:hypothetical protein